MGRKLGAENMIVRNQPGAGGLLATNQTWIAQADGLRIQLMSASGILAAELGGAPGVMFKSAEFSWIGRVTGEPDVIAVAPDSGIETVEDIQAISAERKVRIGSSGIGDIDYVGAKLLTLMFNLSSDIIVGFSGAREVYASMARRELDMFTSSYSMARQAQAADSARIKWLFDDKADPELSDIAPLGAFLTGDNLQLLRAHSDLIAGGRSLAGPPGMDAGRLRCLRDAFDRTIEDPNLLAEATGMKRPVSPLNGTELSETISRLTREVPQAYLDILVDAYRN